MARDRDGAARSFCRFAIGPGRLGVAAPATAAALLVVSAAALVPGGRTVAQEPATPGQKGERLYRELGCYGCHTMGKTGTPIAPDLSKIGAKRDAAYLERWLRDPASQRPTAHMPKIEMSAADARALAAYLSSLR